MKERIINILIVLFVLFLVGNFIAILVFFLNLSSWLGWAFLICSVLFIVIMTINDKGSDGGFEDLEC